jgi:hypothetical protein
VVDGISKSLINNGNIDVQEGPGLGITPNDIAITHSKFFRLFPTFASFPSNAFTKKTYFSAFYQIIKA